uniref:Uncharacterized protein n=1 Tax=Timema shepardi TaxID=629360 RepID=A0A7R9FZS1_TIMSH|nr:unnamed protein product [Timema shepardi]
MQMLPRSTGRVARLEPPQSTPLPPPYHLPRQNHPQKPTEMSKSTILRLDEGCARGLGRLYLEEVYQHFHGEREVNHFGKTFSTPDRDSNIDLPVIGSLVYFLLEEKKRSGFDAKTCGTPTNLVVNQGSFSACGFFLLFLSFFLPSSVVLLFYVLMFIILSTFFLSYQVEDYIRGRVPAHHIAIYCISALKEGLHVRHNDEDEGVGYTATLDGITVIQ